MATSTGESTGDDVRPDEGGHVLLRKKGLAELLDWSPRTIDRYDAAGLLPRPIQLGGSKRWRRAEIVGWIAAGCPPRKQWEAMSSRRLPSYRGR
jgi:predicted DNA-binding transcriptional regulator AlpA